MNSENKLNSDYFASLLLLQSMPTRLSDEEIHDIIILGLKDFPGVKSIIWKKKTDPISANNTLVLPLQYGQFDFGYLQLSLSDKIQFTPFLPYLQNFAALVAVVIENNHQAKKAITVQERFFAMAPDLLCIANPQGYFTKLSPSWENTLGWTRKELCARPFIEFIHPDDRTHTASTLETLISGKKISDCINRYRHKDGSYRWLEWTSSPETGSLIFATARDITKTRSIAKDLQLAASVYNNTNEAIFVFNQDGEILSVNNAFTNITDFSYAQAVGANITMLDSKEDHDSEKFSSLSKVLSKNGHWKNEVWCARQSGKSFLTCCNVTLVQDEYINDKQRFVCVMNDITEQKEDQQRIHQLAYHDPLTGLANRSLLEDRLNHALSMAKRNKLRMAVLFIDIDDFKSINDTLGHDIGDYVLQVQAKRLLACIRQSDTAARMGGDEFVIFVDAVKNSANTSNLAQKILTKLSLPIAIKKHSVQVTSSIGIAIFPEDGTDRVSLMKSADTAMYTAKAFGKNAFRYFSAAMMERTNQRLQLEMELRTAIEENQFEMYYQPRVCLASKQISGAEALIRWNHPEKGLICPMQFIPYAEEAGIINEIGRQVISSVIQQIAQWKTQLIKEIPIAINISALQFNEGQIRDTIVEECNVYHVAPSIIELEVTESVVMNDPEKAAITLQALRDLGIRIAIDDFGTGHSSLAYLKKLPLDTLKIDQSFVHDLQTNADDIAIVKLIVALAKVLNLQLTAEGVELSVHEKILNDLNCEHAQGFYYAKPMPAKEFADYLMQQQNPAPKY